MAAVKAALMSDLRGMVTFLLLLLCIYTVVLKKVQGKEAMPIDNYC